MDRMWLKQARLKQGFTQQEVARRIQKTGACYHLIEKGTRRPSVELAKKIGEVLEFDWTLFYTEKEPSNE